VRARRILYTILACLLLPIGILWGFLTRRHRPTLLKRLGLLGWNEVTPDGILIHAVSVGEFLAVRKLAQTLQAAYPDLPITISTTTLTGQLLAEKGPTDSTYFPVDLPFCVNRFLASLRPRLVLIAETEVWPNFLYALKQRGIPVIMVNGRLSDSSFASYRKYGGFFSPFLQVFHLILAQSDEDRERFEALGARQVRAVGNLKYDFSPPHLSEDSMKLFQTYTLGRKAWAAGSTMPGEDEHVLDIQAFLVARGDSTAFLLAPRHPERVPDIIHLCKQRNLTCVRRTEFREGQRPNVVILDTVGELGALYQFFPVVFIGGSLVPTGGHNIIEPAYFGCDIVVGPHMENFRAMTEAFLQEKAIVQVGIEDLQETVVSLLADSGGAGSRARHVVEKSQGALQITLDTVAGVLK